MMLAGRAGRKPSLDATAPPAAKAAGLTQLIVSESALTVALLGRRSLRRPGLS